MPWIWDFKGGTWEKLEGVYIRKVGGTKGKGEKDKILNKML